MISAYQKIFRRKKKFIDSKQQTRLTIEILVAIALFPLMIFALTVFPGISDVLLGNKALEVQNAVVNLFILMGEIWYVVLIALVFTVSLLIYFTHRVFGPIFRIKAIIRAKLNNEEITVNKLRKGDYFSDLLDVVNQLIDKYEGKD